MHDAAGRSRWFAFLTFEEPVSVNAVMVREHFLDGKIMSSSFLPFSPSQRNWALLPFQFLDRPEKSHPKTRTPMHNKALHQRTGVLRIWLFSWAEPFMDNTDVVDCLLILVEIICRTLVEHLFLSMPYFRVEILNKKESYVQVWAGCKSELSMLFKNGRAEVTLVWLNIFLFTSESCQESCFHGMVWFSFYSMAWFSWFDSLHMVWYNSLSMIWLHLHGMIPLPCISMV